MTASFLIEGFRPDLTDAQVHALVSSIVSRLYNFYQVARHSGVAAGTKAYRIEVDQEASFQVLDCTCASGPRSH